MSTAPPASPVPAAVSGAERPLHRNPWLWAAVLGLIAIPLLRPLFRHEPAPPPVLWALPAFSLVDQAGQTVDRSTLTGRVWLAFFFFSRCRSIGPRPMKSMVALQHRYERWKNGAIHLVGISVDPQYDRPPRLDAYLREHGGSPQRFTLLTSRDGQDAAIRALIAGGFKNRVGAPAEQAGIIELAHSGRIALVDQRGRVRGFYGTDEKGLDEAFHRSLHVWLQGRAAAR